MKFQLLSSSYAFEVSRPDLLKIMDNDGNRDDELYKILDRIKGVSKTDYDGHFGPYIYCTIEKEFDTVSTRRDIMKKIEEYIKN